MQDIDLSWADMEIKFEPGCEVTTWDGKTGLTGVVVRACIQNEDIFFQIAKNDKLYQVPNGQIRCVTKTKNDIIKMLDL